MQENELKAIIQFLSIYVTPFKADRLRTNVLETLVNNSEVLIIESDSQSFTHNTNDFALLKVERAKIKKLPKLEQKQDVDVAKMTPMKKVSSAKTKNENDEQADFKTKTDENEMALMSGSVTERGGEEDEINEEDSQALVHPQYIEEFDRVD